MAQYKFTIRKHVRDDMFKTESVVIELSDAEYKSISSDNGQYAKGSALVSSKLGEQVMTTGFPTIVNSPKSEDVKGTKGNDKKKKSSLWKPIWAFPFKLIWRLVTGF